MRKHISFWILITVLNASAQLVKEKTLSLGLNWPNASVAFNYSTNFPAKGIGYFVEYKQSLCNWLDFVSYAAYSQTTADTREWVEEDYFSTQNAFTLGSKTRITFPIPYVAPYLELGFGLGFGKFDTNSPTLQLSKNGLTPHTLYGFGFEIGNKKHGFKPNYDMGLIVYRHYVLKQKTNALIFIRFQVFYKTKNVR